MPSGAESPIDPLVSAGSASGSEEFWIAAIDQTWTQGRCVASRQSWGMAQKQGRRLFASDRRDEEMVALCGNAASSAASMLRNVSTLTRIVCRVTRERDAVSIETTVVLTRNALSVVTTPELWADDDRLLQRLSASAPQVSAPIDQPLLWCHGSAAVLLHEAAGHAAEHGAPRESWPQWLCVEDRSKDGSADLLAGQIPLALRRESFSDVPLPRMTSVVVEQSGAPFDLPEDRVDVLLVAGGAYDPITEEVTIHVAAAEAVRAGVSTAVRPFVLRASRSQVAAAMRGASGLPERYPGVICSREGQELYVSSAAPRILTRAFATA